MKKQEERSREESNLIPEVVVLLAEALTRTPRLNADASKIQLQQFSNLNAALLG